MISERKVARGKRQLWPTESVLLHHATFLPLSPSLSLPLSQALIYVATVTRRRRHRAFSIIIVVILVVAVIKTDTYTHTHTYTSSHTYTHIHTLYTISVYTACMGDLCRSEADLLATGARTDRCMPCPIDAIEVDGGSCSISSIIVESC